MNRLPLALLAVSIAFAARPAVAADAAPASFAKEIRPLLATYCAKCHNDDMQEGGVNYAPFTDDGAALARPKLWKRAKGRVSTGEMPPEGAKMPTAPEKEKLVQWMTFAAGYLDCDPARRDPGPAPLRRLTRTEYNNTINDLFGVPFDAGTAVGLPEDPVGEGHFDNLAVNLSLSPAVMDKYFAAADKVVERIFGSEWYANGARQRVFVVKPGDKLPERDAARQIVTNLARRAFRRPARAEDVARLLGFYDRAKAKGDSFEDAVRATLKPVLVSPQFLFRIEEDRPPAGKVAGVVIDDHELAVRLSYFLWSTMPDAELFKLADAGQLSTPAVLEKQVQRMLKDQRAKALTNGFAIQWLHVDKLTAARPTTEFFPTFNDQLKRAMRDEVIAFFEAIRTEDRSVLDLLDADYTFVNEPLAKHYGIAGVSGDKLRKVTLEPAHHRGGVLGMGAVLALTSHTFRTSPTQRGKYVLDVIFGTPPSPPPPNVGTIKDDKPAKGKKAPMTFKEQLAQHATQASCAGCHRKIDPLGFALDNYNAVGAWREGTPDNPLDTTGVLPSGEKVGGAADLKRVILSRKDDFAKNFTAKLLEYALGRELDAYDDCTVRDAHVAMQKNGYKLSALVTEIVTSVPFRQRRATK
ncbi:DUF1592 domain-containing protein [Fimbriiglobus ruber]|uniref:Cellulose-binding domain protein n=1 Tax=Fimbriiglobus ruber TaxID=1908690 RepID=A0A225D3U6_9BACT|nr:DUF1592 domain-containing protein [Fimbriiglobus ruber]OWK36172.1 hypothetical protein FRUB_08735 [Fimbriiglobus ruber]